MHSSCEAFPRPFRQLPHFQGHNSPTHSCPKQFPQKGMPHQQSNILFISKFIWNFTSMLAAQSSYLPQVCLFRGRPQPRYLLSIKPTGKDRSLVPLGEELARAVPLNMRPVVSTMAVPQAQLTPGLRLSHSSRIQPHKALHLCRISPPVSRWRILR